MTITVNGSPQQVDPGCTIAQLLVALGWPAEGVAVAMDSRVVPRSQHGSTVLTEGCAVEVLRAVGGG
ncbi:MAG: sulfur carrier protein ThiS [Myxococcales bacterium]|nr:sulfur carrier protein ThiS [Myxococcales bacterium]